jgi:hypothetical protein
MRVARDMPRLPFTDRCALRWRLARAWRTGKAEQRATHLGQAQALEGSRLEGLRRQPGGPVAASELYFGAGTTLRIGRSHCPTFDRLATALRDGPVALDRAADHGRFFGLYFHTARGSIALLVNQVAVSGNGGLRRTLPELVLA